MISDCNFLLGIVALQNNFVSREQLVEAMNAWILDRQRPLGDILRERKALSAQNHALLEALVNTQLQQHQGDVRKSIQALDPSASISRMLDGLAGEGVVAEQDYDAAVGIFTQLAAEFPTRPEYLRDLARNLGNRGVFRSDMGRLKEAEQDYDAALPIQKKLSAEFPTRSDFRHDLARTHSNRGILLGNTGRSKEAEQDYEAALAIKKQLVAELPDRPELRNDLAGTIVNLALLLRKRGDLDSAKRRLLEGRPHHLAALQASPRNPTFRQFYNNHLNLLTGVHAGLLEKEEALRTAKTRGDLGWDPPGDAYDGACFLSECVPIVAGHDKLDDAKRKDLTRFYGDESMKLLQEAVKRGYKDVAHMRQDRDLDPLRDRKDFQTLLAEMEKKP